MLRHSRVEAHPVLVVNCPAEDRSRIATFVDVTRVLLTHASDYQHARQLVDDGGFDAIIAVAGHETGPAIEFLAHAAQSAPLTRRLLATASQLRDDLLAAINLGRVSHVLVHPIDPPSLDRALSEALQSFVRERDMIEEMLLARYGKSLEQTARVGRDAPERARPPGWPAVGTINSIDEGRGPAVIAALLSQGFTVSFATLVPARSHLGAAREGWSAEIERLLVGTLRDTDAAFRTSDGRYVVAFAETPREGCTRASERLRDALKGDLLFELTVWERGNAPEPLAFATQLLATA